MGQELGQWQEWSEARSLDWDLLQWQTHRHTQTWMRDLNTFYKTHPALYEHDFDQSGFQWIEANDSDQSVFTYMRFADDPADMLVIACNFTPIPRPDYQIGVPVAGHYQEVLNSDSELYGGGNMGNLGGVDTQANERHGWPQSLSITLPPLAIVIFKLVTSEASDKGTS